MSLCDLTLEEAKKITDAEKYKTSKEKTKLRQEAFIKRKKAAGFSRLPSVWVQLDEVDTKKLGQILKTSTNKQLKSIIKHYK